MANKKPISWKKDPIELIKYSSVPLRLQDIVKLCEGDRGQILRAIESQRRKERLELQEIWFANGGLAGMYQNIDADNDVEEDWDEDEAGDQEPEAIDIMTDLRCYIHIVKVRKGFPFMEFYTDFVAIRNKWYVHGHEANANPKGYERLFMPYWVKREIMGSRVRKGDKKATYPLKRKKAT
jgi:hypothetical protein